MYLPEIELYTDVINYLVSIKIGEDYNTPSGHYQSFCEVGTSTLHQQKDGRPNDMIRKSFLNFFLLKIYLYILGILFRTHVSLIYQITTYVPSIER